MSTNSLNPERRRTKTEVRSPRSDARSPQLTLADFLGRDSLVKLFRLTSRHRERLPLPRLQVLRQEYDLSAMISVMRDLTIDRLHDRVRLSSDHDRALNIHFGQRLEG